MFKNIIIALSICVTSFSAWAAPQTFVVTAVANSVMENTPGSLPGTLRNGDLITLTYTLDTDKSPDFSDPSYSFYSFNQSQAGLKVEWAGATIKTSPAQSMVFHRIDSDPNTNNLQTYAVWGGPDFLTNGSVDYSIYNIRFDLVSFGPYQTYTPWLVPDLSKFNIRDLMINAEGYSIDAYIVSIVNAESLDGPFPVWPGHGTMHPAQQFDAYVTAPAGYDAIELRNDPVGPILPIPCDVLPSYNGQNDIICHGLNAVNLQLAPFNYNGINIRLKNTATSQTLERVMNWRVPQ